MEEPSQERVQRWAVRIGAEYAVARTDGHEGNDLRWPPYTRWKNGSDGVLTSLVKRFETAEEAAAESERCLNLGMDQPRAVGFMDRVSLPAADPSEERAGGNSTESKMAKKATDGTAAPKAPRTTGRGGPHTVGTNIIRMGRDSEGVPYGAKRNPKRGRSATRFALYKDGLTVNKAVELGLTKADIAYDVAHNFITLETPGA